MDRAPLAKTSHMPALSYVRYSDYAALLSFESDRLTLALKLDSVRTKSSATVEHAPSLDRNACFPVLIPVQV